MAENRDLQALIYQGVLQSNVPYRDSAVSILKEYGDKER